METDRRTGFPTDKQTDAEGWTEVSERTTRPRKRHAPSSSFICNGRRQAVESNGAKSRSSQPLHLRAARYALPPLISDQVANPRRPIAKRQRPDRRGRKAEGRPIVLGETLPYFGLGKSPVDTSEPVPGPSTEYFGSLARQHDLYIVLSVFERDGHLVYNTAVALGPDGTLVGKYRKVCLPRGEVAAASPLDMIIRSLTRGSASSG